MGSEFSRATQRNEVPHPECKGEVVLVQAIVTNERQKKEEDKLLLLSSPGGPI